jgi:hypothetical protein
MYVCMHLQVTDINFVGIVSFTIWISLILGLGSLWFHARVHDRVHYGFSKNQCIECTSEFCRIWTKTCQEGAPEEVIDSRRSPQGC